MDSNAWEPHTWSQFQKMLSKIPVFLRPMAEQKVGRKAFDLSKAAGRSVVTEEDMVNAFFQETPFGFHGPMKTDMLDIGIDFAKYGHPQ